MHERNVQYIRKMRRVARQASLVPEYLQARRTIAATLHVEQSPIWQRPAWKFVHMYIYKTQACNIVIKAATAFGDEQTIH